MPSSSRMSNARCFAQSSFARLWRASKSLTPFLASQTTSPSECDEFDAQIEHRSHNARMAPRPIEADLRAQCHALANTAHDQPIAIVLDLVNPRAREGGLGAFVGMQG